MTVWLLLIVVAVPLVLSFANHLKRTIPHGEARFNDNGKLIDDE